MFPNRQTLDLFTETGASLKGHFRLTSGMHSPEYLQCAKVLQHPGIAEFLGAELADGLRSAAQGISFVIAPAMGGLIIGHEVARKLGVRFIFTERDGDGKMTLRRGFTIEQGERGVLIEDVITTGGSSKEVLELVKRNGGTVLAAGSIIDRSGGKADLGIPRGALAVLEPVTYSPEECPLCKEGLPVVKPGSRPSS